VYEEMHLYRLLDTSVIERLQFLCTVIFNKAKVKEKMTSVDFGYPD